MKSTSGSGHNVYPNADPAAPQANPTGAPAIQPAPSSGPQSKPKSFNVDRAGSKAASGNNKVTATSVGATSSGKPSADQAPGIAPGSPAAAAQEQATNDANARAAKLGMQATAVGATQDTVDHLSSKRPAQSDPAGGVKPTPAPSTGKPSPGSRQPLRAKAVEPSKLGSEDLLQRLRYFENLAETHVEYIKVLQGLVSRTGTAVPAMPHVKTLLSAAGNVDPNAKVAFG